MDTIDYKASFEQSSALMMMLNTDFTIVAVSDSFLNATKTIRESIIGRDVFDVFPDNPNDITADGESNIRASLNRVLKNKTTDTISVIKYDIPLPESDGGGFVMKYWQPCHSPVLDEFNNVRYIIQRVEDVTDNETLIAQLEVEKRLLKQASDSEKRYSMLLMKSPFAFAVFKGKEMVITVANDSMKKIWQKDGQIEGKPLFEVLPELKDTLFPGLLDDVYTTGIPFRGDDVLAQFQRGDKLEDSYYNFIYQPYLEADETISGVSAIVWEVTGQVLVKKALAQQAEAEKKALKSIQDSNKRYHTMLMESPFAVSIIQGEDMVVTLANDLMKKFWGKGTDIEGKTLLNILPELKDQAFPAMIISVLNSGTPVYANEILAKLKHNDKMEDRYFNIVYQPYHEVAGTISGVTAIAYEVTEMVLTRKKIEESELHFRQMADLMPSNISNADTEGNVLYFNKRWLDYTGMSFAELQNLGYHKIIHPDELEEFQKRFKESSDARTDLKMEMRFLDKNGEYKWHLNIASPVKDKTGNITMWVGSTTEIQELRMLQQQKDDFISIASHELKTPVTSLKASLQLLNRIKDNPSNIMLPKLIGQANKSLDKVTALMDDLLNASIANEGQLHVNKKLVTLSEIIEDCCPHVRAAGIFSIKTEGDMQVKVYADAARIDQVVINFVNNAIKYAPGSKEIRICIEKVNDMAKVSVIDKGQGIPQEKLLHLFDRFYRVDSSGSQYSGLGLGLYISSEIIKKHNGQIGVDSELGKGSTFWFTLPVA